MLKMSLQVQGETTADIIKSLEKMIQKVETGIMHDSIEHKGNSYSFIVEECHISNRKTFGDGYTYDDLVNSAAMGAAYGHERLATGIDNYMNTGKGMMEFNTNMSGNEVLEYFNKTFDDFKTDVVRRYISERRIRRKTNYF